MSAITQRKDNIIEMPGARERLPKEAWDYMASQGKGRKLPETLDDLTFDEKRKVDAWKLLINRAAALHQEKSLRSWKAGVELMLERIQLGLEAANIVTAAELTARGERAMPSYPNLANRRKLWKKHGDKGLFDNYQGKVIGFQKWWVPFFQLWLSPEKRKPAPIALKLREQGFEVSNKVVQNFAKNLPEHLGEHCRWRVGKNYHTQNFTPYVIRDYSVIPVGHTWEADGHRCDFYVRHPVSGQPYRPELTFWIDWASDMIIGWRLWDRESALNTLFSLANAIYHSKHVPTVVHLDHGAGFKNKLMDGEEVTAYFQHLGITPQFARPGNPRSKGKTEGAFALFEERCGKFFETYCGRSRTDIFMARSEIMMKRGDVYVPAFREAEATIQGYVDSRNNQPRKTLAGRTPLQAWTEDRVHNPPMLDAEELARMRVKRTVRSSRVRYDNNIFGHEKLGEHLGREVVVEFDPLSYEHGVWVRELCGKHICKAYRVVETPAAPVSFLQSCERQRLKRRVATGQRKIDEAYEQMIEARPPSEITDQILEVEQQHNELNTLHAAGLKRAAAGAQPVERGDDDPPIDIYSTDY